MRTRKQEHLPFRRRASFKEASSFSRRSMRKTSSFSLTLALYALATCHLRNPKTFAEQKAGLGSEEKNWGGNPQKG